MGNVKIPTWLKGLPLAPEFRPTDTEFADPIAYISKIEKEASAFGICKIVPPLPKPSKKYAFGNLNKSLSKCPELGCDVDTSKVCSATKMGCGDLANNSETRAVFTTRHQELGQSGKKTKGSVDNPQLGFQKQVWQSGEIYTLEEFEAKSKAFAKSLLSMIKEVSPLIIEALFWKTASEKPIYVEYANDVPGSAFGEPDHQFRYFHRRRRKRMSYKRKESSDRKKYEMDAARNSRNDEIKDASVNTHIELPNSPTNLSTATLDENSCSRQKSVNVCNDMKGTAGWKLSNSPWNLQVIARASGSLTRFMPDDIPGVTSPMVYIGMLFSWFAWHVEDHELHSMNFLHTGSSKTWYAVPGDYAYDFEEVIRTEAYGGNIDRLAALSLLGEKTTLLSPEVLVASGIPCCRLIQNPGEFVVTFPRAYHVGFSHGFNCGEAANFGTPQWLKVAKEAAVRRAAMNYLPMLSHQQLLYLLTMSFVSRIPRSLLPGARSSRLRDRQKEERELLVKKAFIEDMLNENNLLSVLLGRGSNYRSVTWDPDLLPFPSKGSEFPCGSAATTLEENVSEMCSENNIKQNSLLDEMSLYMENLNDLYMNEDDDLLCDFQVDSGTLACVACGILGYPFMSVVQPSARASMEILQPHQYLDCTFEGSASENLHPATDPSLPPKDAPTPSTTKLNEGWISSIKYLRPRIFCLEHAVQIEELLQSKGGANMLLICHSDFQKIKAHAAAVAEEIGSPFNCTDVLLDTALLEDLNLINLAIDDENGENEQDWTSELGVNLKYCVKVRKDSPFKQVQHALPLSGLFSEKSCSSDFSNVKWQSRRSRSKVKKNHPSTSEPCESVVLKMHEASVEKRDINIIKKDQKIIQYSRRKKPKKGLQKENLATCRFPDQYNRNTSVSNLHNVETTKRESVKLSTSPGSVSERQHEIKVVEATCHRSMNSSLSGEADSPATADLVVGRIENTESQKVDKIKITEETSENNDISFADRCSTSCAIASDERLMENVSIITEACNLVSEGQCEELSDGSVLSGNAITANLVVAQPSAGRCHAQLEGMVLEKPCMSGGFSGIVSSETEVQQEKLNIGTNDNEENTFCDIGVINKPDSTPICLSPQNMTRACAVEISPGDFSLKDKVQQENKPIRVLMCISRSATLTKHVASEESLSAAILSNDVASENEVQLDDKITNASKEALLSSSVAQMAVDLPSTLSLEECSVFTQKNSAEEDLHGAVTLDIEVQQEASEVLDGDEVVSDANLQMKERHTSTLVGGYSEVPLETCAKEKVFADATRDGDGHENDQTGNKSNVDSISCCLQHMNKPTSPVRKYSRTRKDTCATVNVDDGREDCSVPANREHENIESALVNARSNAANGKKRKREVEETEKLSGNGFIRGPCEGLRPRARQDATVGVDVSRTTEEKKGKKEVGKSSTSSQNKRSRKESYKCDMEGCRMSFETKEELRLHKRNRCPYEGCGKRFRSHKYAALHQRVHEDDRPFKCPWKGCSMSFKWAWARTEHIRVHTGERPYQCKVEGCGLSFRFVSDFSRHRRKTGHYMNSGSEA